MRRQLEVTRRVLLMAVCFLASGIWMANVTRVGNAQGVYAPGLGAINRSMGSAAVAAPLDGIGAIAWNPATVEGIRNSEITFSVELLMADIETSSSIGGFGAGSTTSDSGAMPLPNMAWVHKTPNSRWTVGFGILSVAGFKTNFAGDPTNPILAPQRSALNPIGGFGQVHSEAAFIDMAPTISYAVTDQLSIGVSPVVTLARLDVAPLVFAGLNDADGDNFSTYPRSEGTRYHWGGGANLGLYYVVTDSWSIGAAVKTPRWMEDFTFNSEDEVGNPLTASFDLDLPLVASVGTSFTHGNCLWAVDVRYIDYENANGFGDFGVAADGSIAGLGWNSVIAVATGTQFRLTDCLVGRLGYIYNDNPIPDALTQFNVAAPLHYEHTLSCGLSYQPASSVSLNVSYSYAFESSITGSIILPPNPPTATPPTPVPNSSVGSILSAHAVDFGVTVAY